MSAAMEDLTERVAEALENALPEGQTIITKKGVRRGKGGTATVSKSKAKQDDLPSMEEHQRRIPEIEDLADELIDIDDRLSALKEQHKDAMENLVVSMKKHDRTFYERQTWGRVILKEAATKARVTKAVLKSPDADGESESGDGTED